MPKTDPMSAEEFLRALWRARGASRHRRAPSQATIDIIAQRDRAVLEQAADRLCAKCGPSDAQAYCGFYCNGRDEGYACSERKAVLSPIADEKDGL